MANGKGRRIVNLPASGDEVVINPRGTNILRLRRRRKGLVWVEVLDQDGETPLAGRAYELRLLGEERASARGTLDDEGRLRHELLAEDYVLAVEGCPEVAALVLDQEAPEPHVRCLGRGTGDGDQA
jgi:hypothetical protein